MFQKSFHKISSFALLFKNTNLENMHRWVTFKEMFYLVKKKEYQVGTLKSLIIFEMNLQPSTKDGND